MPIESVRVVADECALDVADGSREPSEGQGEHEESAICHFPDINTEFSTSARRDHPLQGAE